MYGKGSVYIKFQVIVTKSICNSVQSVSKTDEVIYENKNLDPTSN